MLTYSSIQLKSRTTGSGRPVGLEIGLWFLFSLALMVKCFYFQFNTKLNSLPYFSAYNMNMLLLCLSSTLFIVSFILLVFNRKRRGVLLGIGIFLSILLFADTLYYRYYYNAITIPVLYQISVVGSVKESADNLFRLSDLLYFADIPLFIAGMLMVRRASREGLKKFHIKFRAIAAAVVFICALILFNVTYAKASTGTFFYDNNYVINNTGILYFHYYDVKKFVIQNFLTDRSLTDTEKKQLEDFYEAKKTDTDAKYTGIAKGKNLIVVQVEALQQFVVNTSYNGQEITPNLNKLIKESAYFENYYFMTGAGNTSDAEFLSNNSLYPLKEGSVYFRYPSNTLESTGKLLKDQGYNTFVFHANNPSFWNRTEMYKAEGFDRFYSNSDFLLDEHLGWGLGDKSMFRQALDKLDTSKPFYSFFITLASHHPFNYFEDYGTFDAGKYNKTFVGNYMKAANYADEALGGFIEDLKKRGLYDNSVLVIYGDHSAIQKDQQDQIDAITDILHYNNNEFNWLRLQKVPCFIHFPGMTEFGTMSKIGGEIDLLPTLANLMGFEVPHALGKDLFNSSESYAVLRNSSVITEDFTYVNANDTVYDSNGVPQNKKDYDARIQNYQKLLGISDVILAKNALKILEKEK